METIIKCKCGSTEAKVVDCQVVCLCGRKGPKADCPEMAIYNWNSVTRTSDAFSNMTRPPARHSIPINGGAE
jgi:hypothetical protein